MHHRFHDSAHEDGMARSRCLWFGILVSRTHIVSGPAGIPAVDPGHDRILLCLAVPFLKHAAKRGEIALDLEKILLRNLLLLRLEGRFELGPELSELFLIHDVLLGYG
jgi:hypothetical protein